MRHNRQVEALPAGAEKVCFCDAEGKIRFDDRQQELSKSLLVPDFPDQIRRRNQPIV